MSGDLARGDDRWQVSCCEIGVNSGDRYRKLTSGKRSTGIGPIFAFIVVLVLCPSGIAATVSPHSATAHKPKSSQKISENQHARKRMHHLAHSRATTTTTAASTTVHRRHHYYERFSTSSFAPDI